MFPLCSILVLAAGLAIAAAAGGTAKPPASPIATSGPAAPVAPAAVAPPFNPKSEIQNPQSTTGPVLRGTISDETGKPVKGVKVQLYGGLATRWEGQSAITGDDGTYSFDPLQSGSMIMDEPTKRWDYYVGIRIEHDAFVPKEGESWIDITVPNIDKQVTTRDFIMSRGGVLDGEIKMQDGFGWGALELRFMPVSGKGTHWYATTDHKGRFATKAMVPGEYSVQWNSTAADYPELAHVKIEPGKRTSVRVRASIRVEARAETAVTELNAQAE